MLIGIATPSSTIAVSPVSLSWPNAKLVDTAPSFHVFSQASCCSYDTSRTPPLELIFLKVGDCKICMVIAANCPNPLIHLKMQQ